MAEIITPGGGDNPAPPPAPQPKGKGAAFVIEFASDQNNETLCPITRRKYRGRWTGSNVKNRVPDDRFARMPDMPGHQIAFDGPGRRLEIVDPMGFPDNRDILREAKSVYKEMNWQEPEPSETRTVQLKTDDLFKTWLYWVRRWLDNSQAVVVRGRVPEMAEIELLPGRVEHNQFDASPKRDKFPDPTDRPAYEAPPQPRGRDGKRGRRD